MSLKKYSKKITVLKWVSDGSFDYRDKKRIKKMTRIRSDIKDIEKNNSIITRVKDWHSDIDRGK